MTFTEIVWYALTIYSAVAVTALLAAIVVVIPRAVERQRRRDETVDRDLEARRAQFPGNSLDAVVESDEPLDRGGADTTARERSIVDGWTPDDLPRHHRPLKSPYPWQVPYGLPC